VKKLNYYIVYHSTIEEKFTASIPNDNKIFVKVGNIESKIKKEFQVKVNLKTFWYYFKIVPFKKFK
jgi:hypothetical protein